MRALAITIDMTSITELALLGGVRLSAEDPLLMYRKPIERFTEFCQEFNALGTVFAISRDITGLATEKLKDLHYKGFEIASHSHSYNLKLSQAQPGEILKDIRLSKAILEQATGKPVVGFRAPGFHQSPKMLQELIGLGFHYDSSVIPSASYYVARAISILGEKLTTKQTTQLVGNPKLVKAPRVPYRPGSDPYSGGGDCNIIELPLSVATPLGIPVSAASMLNANAKLRTAIVDSLKEQDIVVLGVQALDFVDPHTDGLPMEIETRHKQFKTPLDERMEILRSWVKPIVQDRWALTCAQLAAQFG